MLEYTRVKVDGSSEIVVQGDTLYVSHAPRELSGTSNVASPASDRNGCRHLAGSAVDGLLTLVRALFQLAFGLLCAICSELVIPIVRELVCALGALALYLTGAGLMHGATGLLQAGAKLHSHSRLLRAGSARLGARARSAALTTVEK